MTQQLLNISNGSKWGFDIYFSEVFFAKTVNQYLKKGKSPEVEICTPDAHAHTHTDSKKLKKNLKKDQ